MNEIFKKTAKEIVRVILSALLAWLGVSSTGCLAIGDGATVRCDYPFATANK